VRACSAARGRSRRALGVGAVIDEIKLLDARSPTRGMRATIFTEGWLAKLIVSAPAQLDAMIAGRRSAIDEAQRILVALKTVRPKEGTP